MHSCIILGASRSGMSMLAGALSSSGYSMGEGLHGASASNPRGFFESEGIKDLNEELLAAVIPTEQGLGQGQRWLGYASSSSSAETTSQQEARMTLALGEGPFCHKDARFCFTLPAWRPLLGDAHFVCMFRHPALTVESMLEECKRADSLQELELEPEHLFKLWISAYREIMETHKHQGQWHFLHCDQVLTQVGLERLGEFLEVDVDSGFPDSRLRRTSIDLNAPAEALELYEQLCELAQHEDEEFIAQAIPARPDVSLVAIIEEGDQQHCAEMVEDARSQRGVTTEVLFIDKTDEGHLQVKGAHVERCTSYSRGNSWRMAAAASKAALVAWMKPGCRLLPSHLVNAKEALEGPGKPNLVVCDYYLNDAQGQFTGRSHPGQMGNHPGPYWEGGAVMRRETLAGISEEVFHPVELKLWQQQRSEGLVASTEDPGYSVGNTSYEAEQDRNRRDGILLGHQRKPFTGKRPELSLSIVSCNGRETLLECLEAACRQELPRGTFEIVLTNDGLTDGTKEALEGLVWPVPMTIIHQDKRGMAMARNAGLRIARGRYVLFFNDDSISLPDCLGKHLETHASFAPGIKGAVLGHLEQAQEALGNALRRHLEFGVDVYAYALIPPREFISMQYFYACNVSVELTWVRRVGCMDESYGHYGREDTDLGLRLEQAGFELFYQPSARAVHRHCMGFESLRTHSRTLARADVRLFRKHPELMEQRQLSGLTLQACDEAVGRAAMGNVELESAAAELSKIDVWALEQVGGKCAQLGNDTMVYLAELIERVSVGWRNQGYATGLREHGLDGFSELAPSSSDEPRIETDNDRRLLAWPRWDDAASLDRLMELLVPVSSNDFTALILVRDEEADVEEPQALAALQAAYDRRFGESPETLLEVVVSLVPKDLRNLFKLSRTVNGLLSLGGEPESFLQAIAAERLGSPLEVKNWRARFEGPDGAAGPEGSVEVDLVGTATVARGIELSVIIPTHDRPRELKQVIQKLCLQDLEPDRYEVIVVDDASQQPAEEVLAGMQTPFSLQIITQEPGGPGAARNRGVERAQGALIVFFNDDAVPAFSNLRRHLEIQNSNQDQNALIGTFTQLPELVVDSFTRHVETSRVLFAQPMMKSGVVYGGLSFCTGNLSVGRELLLKVQGFDESFPFAGGEDSELGLRLERQLGVRVLYDSSVLCEHDHVLDIHHYFERMKVIGWSASKIEERHGNTGLMNDRPQDDEGWSSLEAELQSTAEEALVVVGQIAAICQHERGGGQSDVSMKDFGEACNGISGYSFRCGMLAAKGGVLPGQITSHGSLGPAPQTDS